MKRNPFSVTAAVAVFVTPLLLPAAASSRADSEDPELVQSREITAQFARELQSALQAALAAGGPVAAIAACKEVAPEIAARLSRETGASVGRTSLRHRNPANAPEPWQAAVLEQFQDLQHPAPAEFFERSDTLGARYMKPIMTAPLCLACHGTELSAEVRQVLDVAYPEDTARGYVTGDVRGAFVVTWPGDN